MPRPVSRTRSLLRDEIIAITTLFGTARNAYQRLALDDGGVVSFAAFQLILGWRAGRPEEIDAIEDAWAQWCGQYLREDRPPSVNSPFRLEISQ